MKKRNKNPLFKIIILILVIVFVYYVGSIFYNRNFNKSGPILMEEKDEQTEIDKLKNRPPIDTEIDLPEQDQETIKTSEPERESQFEISRNDCNNECKNYKTIEKNQYCKQVCGLESSLVNPPNNEEIPEKNCENLSGLEKDYCWRDQAISETNFEKCKKIQDGNIFKQCKNRITEDIIDSQF